MGLLFGQYPYLIGDLAIHVITCAAYLALFIASMIVCYGVISPPRMKRSCFGFRWAILISVMARLLAALDVGLPDAVFLPPEYHILGLFTFLMSITVEVMIVYAVIRTTLHPLRAHGAFRRDTLIASLLAAVLGALGLANFGAACVGEAAFLQYVHSATQGTDGTLDYVYFTNRIQDTLSLLYDVAAVLIGITALALAIYSAQKTPHLPVDRKQRGIPARMIAATVVWTLTVIVVTVLDGLLSIQDFEQEGAPALPYDVLGVVDQAFINFGTLVVLTLLVFCFRGQDTNDSMPYQHGGYGGPSNQFYPPPQGYGAPPNNFLPQQYHGGYPVYSGYPAPSQGHYPMQATPSTGVHNNVPTQAQASPNPQSPPQYHPHPASSVSPPLPSPYSPPPRSGALSPPHAPQGPPPALHEVEARSPPAMHEVEARERAHEMPVRSS